MAEAYWDAQDKGAEEQEHQGLPGNRPPAYLSHYSAKIDGIVRLIQQHPGRLSR